MQAVDAEQDSSSCGVIHQRETQNKRPPIFSGGLFVSVIKVMQSPFDFDNPAFVPMFNESVIINGTRSDGSFQQTIRCCVFSDATGDPLAEDSLDTDAETITLVLQKRDWAFAETLRRNDTILRSDATGQRYKIQSARRDAVQGFVIRARSV